MNNKNYCKNVAEVKRNIVEIVYQTNCNTRQVKDILSQLIEAHNETQKEVNILLVACALLTVNVIILVFRLF